MQCLADGTQAQREWYSSFLLYNIDYVTRNIDKGECITRFEKQLTKEKALIVWIKANNIKVLNSGIRVKERKK